ncbi:hypothetical protein PFISCL1PPCAC_13670, partial [Pristionchus fissidentatus]
VIQHAVPDLVPTPEMDAIMEKSAREKFELDASVAFLRYGGTMKDVEHNNGRHFLCALFGFIVFPYTTSYLEMVVLMITIRKYLRSQQNNLRISSKTSKLQQDFFRMQLLQV